MPSPLVECVPNFSEGRRAPVIEAIVAPFRLRPGVHLLDHRADPDHNRLVVSLVGEPGPLEDALLEAARAAVGAIDMRTHRGAHPRIGAVDVVPFVPLRNITMEECVALAHAFGARYARETGVPVYYYEEAARRPERRRLEEVRRGEFEALAAAVGDGTGASPGTGTSPGASPGASGDRAPDEGGPGVHPTAGATAIGARRFLVAFNVNLRSTDMAVARQIARRVRASGGGLPTVKAVAVELPGRGMVQVSMNLTDHAVNPLHEVLELVRAEAARRGIEVAETELYGLAPAAALLSAAAHSLMLSGFDPAQVIELRLLDLAGE